MNSVAILVTGAGLCLTCALLFHNYSRPWMSGFCFGGGYALLCIALVRTAYLSTLPIR